MTQELIDEMAEALWESEKLLQDAQDIMLANIMPDGISNKDAIAAYIALLDNTRQRNVQTATHEALSRYEAYKENEAEWDAVLSPVAQSEALVRYESYKKRLEAARDELQARGVSWDMPGFEVCAKGLAEDMRKEGMKNVPYADDSPSREWDEHINASLPTIRDKLKTFIELNGDSDGELDIDEIMDFIETHIQNVPYADGSPSREWEDTESIKIPCESQWHNWVSVRYEHIPNGTRERRRCTTCGIQQMVDFHVTNTSDEDSHPIQTHSEQVQLDTELNLSKAQRREE